MDNFPTVASRNNSRVRTRKSCAAVNTMLDAILLPIGRRQPHFSRKFPNGKIDELIAQTYKGDHEKMKLAVNNIAIVVQSLQKEMAANGRFQGGDSFLTAASRTVPGCVRGNRARREHHAGRRFCCPSAKAIAFSRKFPTARSTNSSPKPTRATTRK